VKTPAWNPGSLRACLFDFGGTLDADGVTWQERFFRIYGKNGIRPDREVFRRAFYTADDALIEKGTLRGAGIRETLARQVDLVLDALGLPDTPSTVRDAIVGEFLGDIQRTIERNKPILARLKARYRLGVVSNFYGNLEEVCADLGILTFFDCLVDSSLVGAMKPDPLIFRAALDRMSLKPEETLFIGDNVTRDLEGAKALGMPHVWLSGEAHGGPGPCCPGDPVIRSLPEVLSVLERGWNAVPEEGRP
jgi:FMN phosphatase YigB (HAD superfamily)